MAGTDWQRRADFPTVADLVIKALTDNGLVIDVDARIAGELFGSPLSTEANKPVDFVRYS